VRCLHHLAAFFLLFAIPFLSQNMDAQVQATSRAQQLMVEGWEYMKKGDCRSLSLAEKDFTDAISLEPQNAYLHGILGNVLLAQGSRDIGNCSQSESERNTYLNRAWLELRAAVNLDSTNVLDRAQFVALSELLRKKPEYDGGIARAPTKAELSEFVAQHPELQAPDSAAPDSLESLKAQADSKLSAERKQAVNTELAAAKEAVRAQPTDGFAWSSLGEAYSRLGDYKNAYEATKEAVAIFTERFKPENPNWRELGDPNAAANAADAVSYGSMLVASYVRLAMICDKLHKKRESRRYEESATRTSDVLRMMQPSSGLAAPPVRVEQQSRAGVTRQTQTAPSPQRPAVRPTSCPLPMHEICQMPPFNPQPYDPNNLQPYRAPDTRDYDRCVLGNQREDARYQQCLQQQQR